MFDFLDKLREKPEQVRFHIAVLTAGVITAVIALVWFSVVALQFNEPAQDTGGRAGEKTGGAVPQFVDTFGDVLRIGGERLRGMFDGFGTVEYNAQNKGENGR